MHHCAAALSAALSPLSAAVKVLSSPSLAPTSLSLAVGRRHQSPFSLLSSPLLCSLFSHPHPPTTRIPLHPSPCSPASPSPSHPPSPPIMDEVTVDDMRAALDSYHVALASDGLADECESAAVLPAAAQRKERRRKASERKRRRRAKRGRVLARSFLSAPSRLVLYSASTV